MDGYVVIGVSLEVYGLVVCGKVNDDAISVPIYTIIYYYKEVITFYIYNLKTYL
jgi:hypothetical protein